MVAKKKWLNETEVYLDGEYDKKLPEYQQWGNMRQRCKTGGNYQALHPSYVGTSYADEWESYDVWVDWARGQVGFLSTESSSRIWCLDKDLLQKGNKHYSPDTCVFIPQDINKFLTSSKAARGNLPVGVSYRYEIAKYVAQMNSQNLRSRHLGHFDTPTEAFQAYKVAKESYARLLVTKYTGLVDPRVIDALNNFTVNIDD